MDFKILKKKFISNLIIFSLLIATTLYFLLIFHYLRPNYEMSSKSYEDKMVQAYDEKMELVDEDRINPYVVFNFIKDNVEEGSTVLFFNYSFWVLGRPYLYPNITSYLIEYENDQDLFDYLSENSIDYMIIIDGPHHLASYISLFSKIELDSSIYLLEII